MIMLKHIRRLAWVASVAIADLALAAPAQAALTPLSPGGSTSSPGTTTLSGLTLVTQISGNLGTIFQGTVSGTCTEWVYSGAGGALTFMYQEELSATSAEVDTVAVSSYAGFTTAVGTLTGTLPPGATPVSSDGTPNAANVSADGTTVNFQFTDFTKNSESAVLVVATNATATTAGFLSSIDSLASNTHALAPSAVPEPSTMAIAGLGALGMIGYGLRRRKVLGA